MLYSETKKKEKKKKDIKDHNKHEYNHLWIFSNKNQPKQSKKKFIFGNKKIKQQVL